MVVTRVKQFENKAIFSDRNHNFEIRQIRNAVLNIFYLDRMRNISSLGRAYHNVSITNGRLANITVYRFVYT